jgi:hypothetical protein
MIVSEMSISGLIYFLLYIVIVLGKDNKKIGKKQRKFGKNTPWGLNLENGLVMQGYGYSTKTSPCGFDWEIVLEFGVQIPARLT